MTLTCDHGMGGVPSGWKFNLAKRKSEPVSIVLHTVDGFSKEKKI